MISSISHYNGKYSKNIERLDSANEKVEKLNAMVNNNFFISFSVINLQFQPKMFVFSYFPKKYYM